MAMGGIPVDDVCVSTFNELKTKKAHRFILFTIQDNKLVTVKTVGERSKTYDDFLATLSNDEPCYAVFDYEYTHEDAQRARIVLINWIPDTAKVRSKMIYASTKESLKTKIEGGLVEIQATDASEVCAEAVLAKIKQGKC
jgi:cofilin